MTAANAAAETESEGGTSGLPWWRTLKMDGYLNEKYPGGAEAQARMLEKEGFRVERRGKKLRVADYEKSLVRY